MLWVKTMPDGKYAVDNDKRWDIDENILSDLVSLGTHPGNAYSRRLAYTARRVLRVE
jgi:hypothetical protein